MYPSVDQILGYGWPANMVLHLAAGAFAEPYVLTDFAEAAWAGYSQQPVSVANQQTSSEGYAFMEVQGLFGNYTDTVQQPTGAWVDAIVGGSLQLIAVVDGAYDVIPPVQPGGSWITVILMALKTGVS